MNSIEPAEAVRRLKEGEMIILTDFGDREAEGDIIILADRTTEEQLDFLSRHARGLTCVALDKEIAQQLDLSPMVRNNTSPHETAFTVSVDAANGGSGISIADRWETIRRLASRKTTPEDLVRPGHIFPLIANPGGLAVRQGHTEGAVALAKLAGASPAAVICEILGSGNGMAWGEELELFAQKHNISLLTMESLIEYTQNQRVDSRLKTRYGDFKLHLYPQQRGEPHLALVKEGLSFEEPVLLRIHSECLTGDLLGSRHCDCGDQLEASLQQISQEGGVLLYLRQEGRGIGLVEKIKAYNLQSRGLDTYDANVKLGHLPDQRDYQEAAAILRDLGIEKVTLMTNNPDKEKGLLQGGIQVTRRPLEIPPHEDNHKYLQTKKTRFNHILEGV